MTKNHVIHLDLSQVKNWDTFHEMFKRELGFPDYYGKNMDAWIECIGDIHGDVGMTNLSLPYDTGLTLCFTHARFFKYKHPNIYKAIRECTDFANKSYIEHDYPGAAQIELKFLA